MTADKFDGFDLSHVSAAPQAVPASAICLIGEAEIVLIN
jgi:hypothetical protein